jgi:hypothetical protein
MIFGDYLLYFIINVSSSELTGNGFVLVNREANDGRAWATLEGCQPFHCGAIVASVPSSRPHLSCLTG